jgi:hypothetical protein
VHQYEKEWTKEEKRREEMRKTVSGEKDNEEKET